MSNPQEVTSVTDESRSNYNYFPVSSPAKKSSDQVLVPRRRNNRPKRPSSEQRKAFYDRMETLAKDLSLAVRDEMARRKDFWDEEGDQDEEEKWEVRKQEVFKELEQLVDDIHRAFRDRKKEAVMVMWEKEMQQRRALRSDGGPKRDEDRSG